MPPAPDALAALGTARWPRSGWRPPFLAGLAAGCWRSRSGSSSPGGPGGWSASRCLQAEERRRPGAFGLAAARRRSTGIPCSHHRRAPAERSFGGGARARPRAPARIEQPSAVSRLVLPTGCTRRLNSVGGARAVAPAVPAERRGLQHRRRFGRSSGTFNAVFGYRVASENELGSFIRT